MNLNLTRPTEIRAALDGLGVRPSKALGQNFLADQNILRILLKTAELTPEDVVLEIGPGLGVVTEGLLRAARTVVAVEKDRRLHAFLVERFGKERRLDLIPADLLELDVAALLAKGITCVVANLPYAVGCRMLVNLAAASRPPGRMVVTVQREVAERLAAAPGASGRGMLSTWLQLAYRVRVVKRVSPACFWPRPEVGSAIVRLDGRDGGLPDERSRQAFYELTRRAFMHRRKQMSAIAGRVLGGAARQAAADALSSLGLAGARPQDLSVADWCALVRLLR